jgi:hypothetical protein
MESLNRHTGRIKEIIANKGLDPYVRLGMISAQVEFIEREFIGEHSLSPADEVPDLENELYERDVD